MSSPQQSDGTWHFELSWLLHLIFIPPGSSCGVFTLMNIESLATGNGFALGASLWPPEIVASRRAEYREMALQKKYIPSPFFILRAGPSRVIYISF